MTEDMHEERLKAAEALGDSYVSKKDPFVVLISRNWCSSP